MDIESTIHRRNGQSLKKFSKNHQADNLFKKSCKRLFHRFDEQSNEYHVQVLQTQKNSSRKTSAANDSDKSV